MLIGFGVKAELFPVNTWVPEVYAATTSRVSGLLAGVVSKLALLILLKLLLSVFDMAAAHQLLLIIGMLTLLSGELAAFQARDLRRVLAYSSIAQLGMVAIGFAISGSAGVMAGLAIALHHYLAKPALFLLAEKWGGQLTLLAGASTNAKLGTGVFVLIALSLIGVPPLPGFWAKYLLISALFNDGQDLAYLAVALLLITTIIEAAYLVRIGARLFETGPSRLEPHAKCELVPASILAVYLVAATLFAAPIYDGLSTVADQALDPGAYHAALPANPIAMEDRP
jgi:formate hydrogenlyase subunit 3/multisubunit Na+/H+ antiporter MnhD subunit